MPVYTNIGDIKRDALERAGELSDGTSEYDAKALEYVNDWAFDILAGSTPVNVEVGDPWPWAKSKYPGTLVVPPAYTIGGVAIPHAGSTGTFSAAPAISLQDWMLRVSGDNEFYRVVSHVAGQTAFTIDAAYTSDSVSNAGFSAYKTDHVIGPGILRLTAPMRVYRRQVPYSEASGQIDGIDAMSMDRDYPLYRVLGGVPDRFSIRHVDNAGNFTIRINRIPYTDTKLEYDYIPIPPALLESSELPLPIEHATLLVYGATYSLCIDKNDSRVAEYRELTKAAFESLVQSARKIKGEMQKNMGRIIPRWDMYNVTRRYVPQEALK